MPSIVLRSEKGRMFINWTDDNFVVFPAELVFADDKQSSVEN